MISDDEMTVYDDRHSQYITELFAAQDETLRRIWETLPEKGFPAKYIQPEEGRFLQVIVRASGAGKALEIGTLGGYSSIWIARGLAPRGKLTTLEIDRRYAQIAQAHFEMAGVADRVEIVVGSALETLKRLTDGPFDFVFIDAEKYDYHAYFDWALENTRVGGIIAAHNAFRAGTVVGAEQADFKTEAIRAFNRRVAGEPRVISTIYPAGDGMVVAVKTA